MPAIAGIQAWRQSRRKPIGALVAPECSMGESSGNVGVPRRNQSQDSEMSILFCGDAWPFRSDSRWNAEVAAINQLKKKGRIDGDPLEQSGLAIVALLQKAADLSNDSCERAEARADELSRDLRAVENRIKQLETEIEYFRDRADRAETWLQLIRKEIEEKLIAPMVATSPKSTTI